MFLQLLVHICMCRRLDCVVTLLLSESAIILDKFVLLFSYYVSVHDDV